MAQKSAVVTGILPDAAAGTVDLTSSGLGDVSFAIIVATAANSTNNPQDNEEMAYGLYDGTSIRSVASVSIDNVTTTQTDRAFSATKFIVYGSGGISEYGVSSITDGIRLTLDTDNTTIGRYVQVLLVSGVNADVRTFTPGTTDASTASVTGLSFTPTFVIGANMGGATSPGAQSLISFGASSSTGDERAVLTFRRDGVTTTESSLLYSESFFTGQIQLGAILTWSASVTSWNADGFTTTTSGATGGDLVFVLSTDANMDLGTVTTPTSTGGNTIATTSRPESVLLAMTSGIDTTIQEATNADGVSVGMGSNAASAVMSVVDGDNLTTSNARSKYTASGIIDIDVEASGFTDLVTASLTSLNASGINLNYSAVNATARKGFYIAIDEAADVGGSRTRSRTRLRGRRRHY